MGDFEKNTFYTKTKEFKAKQAGWKKMLDQYIVTADDDWGIDYEIGTRRQNKEKELREKYPAAQDAWERYQVILRLCKEEEQQ